MHSYILTGLRMGPLMQLLRQNGFTPSFRNVGRLLFVMHNALWASFFTWREKKSHGKASRSWPIPDNPVIIIGHWRTGSTYLHLLLSRDKQFVAPSLFQAAFPDCFLTADRFYRPVMGRMVNKRPMDHVHLGFDDAQEDEFAMLKLTLDSPLLDIVFPSRKGYFIKHYEDFNPPASSHSLWMESMISFSRKIVKDTNRTLLLKNPAHSLRIPFLLQAFPNARFIHIHRHPYDVVASSLNLWKVLIDDNLLKGRPEYPTLEEVTEGLNRFYKVISRDLGKIPIQNRCEVAYEDLVADPVNTIKRIYGETGMAYTDEFDTALASFLEKNLHFRKNSYTFDIPDQERVYQGMKDVFEHYNYGR